MNNPNETQLEETNIITTNPIINPHVISTDSQVDRREKYKKKIDSYVIYKFLIKVFIIYIFPGLLLIILGVVEMSVFKAECNFENGSGLCHWFIYGVLLAFYYAFPFPFAIPTVIFIILEIIRKVIKKHKLSREEVKRVLKTDL